MKKKFPIIVLFTSLLLLLFVQTGNAQTPAKLYANVLRSTHDQGVWARAITHDASGNVYLTGLFHGTCDFDPSESGVSTLVYQGGTLNDVDGESDVYIAKYDANGALVWAKSLIEPTFGGMNEERPTAITLDANNHLYLCGFTNTRGFFISKWDTEGNEIWSRYFDDVEANNVLTFGIKTIASGIVVSGLFRETVDFDPSPTTSSPLTAINSDGFLLSLDNDGMFQWVKQLQTNGAIILSGIETTTANEILVTGEFLGTVDFNPDPNVQNLLTSASVSTGSISSSFVAKYNLDGSFVWVKHFRGNSTTDFFPTLIQQDAHGDFVISGSYKGVVTFATGIQVSSVENYNSFIAKMSTNGNLIWAKKIVSTDGFLEQALCANMALDPCGNIYVSGEYHGTCDFDPSPGIKALTSLTNTTAVYMAMYTPEGNYSWAGDIKGLGNPDFVEFNGYLPITIDSNQNVVIAGSFRGTLDFDLSPTETYNLSSNEELSTIAGIFLAKYQNLSPCLLATNDFEKDGFMMYPNPASGQVTIQLDTTQNEVNVEFIDVQGRIILQQKNYSGSSFTFNIHTLPKGIYFIKVTTNTTSYSQKLIIN